jgi:hypothetical protein
VKTEMTIVLPEIEKENCKSFTACAHVVTKGKSLSKYFSGTKWLVASVQRGHSLRFVRLCVEKTGHLHLDLATPAYFTKGWKPKPTHTWSRIQALLAHFIGRKVRVRTEAAFAVPLQKLPESGFIRTLSVESKSRRVSMKLTGGTFSVAGAPVQRIAWSLNPDGKEFEVRLRSTVETTLNATYLEELFRLLTDSLQVFVLNDERNSQ